MKKILIFSTAYLPMIGGAEIAVKEITDRFGNDFQFDLICARIKKDLPGQEKVGRINVYRFGRGFFGDKYYLALCGHRLAARLHRENNYDAIWAIMASFGGFAAMFFKKKNPAVPFLLTLQEGDPLEYIKKRVGIFSSWFSQIFAQADYIQAISNFLAVWAKKMGARCPVEVVPNGVDLKLFFAEIPSQELEGLKEKTDKGEKDKFLIHTGRLIKKNGLINVVSSLRFLPDYVKFLVVGNGPDQQKLKHLSEDLKVRERVIFAGELSHSEMAKYLKISDIFIRPSLSEGLGNSFLEAMAAGVPIIGTSVGGIPDFLGDGETGLFCEIENPENIAQKILLLLGNENLRQKLIMNGKKLVEEKYEWNKIAARMEAIMKQLTA